MVAYKVVENKRSPLLTYSGIGSVGNARPFCDWVAASVPGYNPVLLLAAEQNLRRQVVMQPPTVARVPRISLFWVYLEATTQNLPSIFSYLFSSGSKKRKKFKK